MHWTVAVVTPGPALDWKVTVIFDSGVSVNADGGVLGVPEVQAAL